MVLAHKRVVGGEIDIAPVGADAGQPRGRGIEPEFRRLGFARTRRDQLRPTVDVLVDVLSTICVGGNQRVFRTPEGAAIVCHEQAVLACIHFGCGRSAAGDARHADELAGRRFIRVHLSVPGVVILCQGIGRDEGHVAVVGGYLHPENLGVGALGAIEVQEAGRAGGERGDVLNLFVAVDVQILSIGSPREPSSCSGEKK